MNDVTLGVSEMNLRRLTPSERIWLWRRRRPSTTGRVLGRGGSRMSMGEAAAHLNLPTATYVAAESGNDPDIVQIVLDLLGDDVKQRPSVAELCALARRRSRVEVDDLCRAMGGISRPTFFARETEGSPELIDLWRARGYEF